MSKQKKVLFSVLAVVLIVAIMGGVWFFLHERPTAGGKTIEVEVQHTDGTVAEFTIRTDEEFLAPALEAESLISGSEGEFGLFIDTVDGEFADSAAGQWWTFTINGEYGSYGADTQPIEDGDVYTFSIYEE